MQSCHCLLYTSGLRKGEILGLKFSDLDMEKRTVTIRRQIASDPLIKKGSGSKIDNYGLIERDPKTPNSFRVLRVPAIIIEELEKRRRLVAVSYTHLDVYKRQHTYTAVSYRKLYLTINFFHYFHFIRIASVSEYHIRQKSFFIRTIRIDASY